MTTYLAAPACADPEVAPCGEGGLKTRAPTGGLGVVEPGGADETNGDGEGAGEGAGTSDGTADVTADVATTKLSPFVSYHHSRYIANGP